LKDGWLDVDLMKDSVDIYAENQFDTSALVIPKKTDSVFWHFLKNSGI
jgi:hypothetical protein